MSVKDQLEKNIQSPTDQPPATGEPQETLEKDEDAEIARLAQLSILDYERERQPAAKTLGINRVSMLDKIVKQKQLELKAKSSGDELTDGIEPWEHPVDGGEIIDTIRAAFQRYTILPTGGDVALSLWAMGTYCFDAFRIFPKLCVSSPEKRCGKTITMEVLGSVVHVGLGASNVSPSVIFRAIDLWKPSLLIDEGDTFLNDNEELRGIINSGHTRSGAFVLRTEGEGANRQPRKFSTWAPMAIAMIKTPPDTIKDRSVMITLRRKLPGESVDRLPIELAEQHRDLRQKCQRWAIDSMDVLKSVDPNVPPVGNDRAEDNWRSLLAIADHIGGEWPNLARSAMLTIEGDKRGEDDGAGSMILSDIRQVFDRKYINKIKSSELIKDLIDMEDRPWCEWKRGKPITAPTLARMLKHFAIKPKTIRFEFDVKKGYELTQFEDAFKRYLPAPPISSVTPLQPNDHGASSVTGSDSCNVTENQSVTLRPNNHAGCNGVTVQKGGYGNEDTTKSLGN